jgi:beta-glucanase (GH16 family)
MCSGVSSVGQDGRDATKIDIVEMPWHDGRLTFNLHWDGDAKEHKSAGTNTTISAVTNRFHDYGLLWTPEEYVCYVDGKEVWLTKAGGVSQVPEFLKLTEEIGE